MQRRGDPGSNPGLRILAKIYIPFLKQNFMENLEKLSDSKLMEFNKNGHRKEAVEILYKRYFHNVYGLCLKIIRNEAEAEDIASDVFKKLIDKSNYYKEKNNFKGWILTIARNESINKLRKKRQMHYGEISSNDYKIVSFEEGISKKEIYKELREQIELLDENKREILNLRYFHELKYEEIAEKLGIKVGTVKTRLFHAHAKLRNILSSKKDFFYNQ